MENIVTPRSVFMPFFCATDCDDCCKLRTCLLCTRKSFVIKKKKSYAQAQGQPAEFATLF